MPSTLIVVKTECADQWLRCGQSAPGSVTSSVCPVWGCAPMRRATDVYSLMVGDQLVPKQLLGAFLCASGSEIIAPLLVSRRSLLPRVGVKNDADWKRHMWCGPTDKTRYFVPCFSYSVSILCKNVNVCIQ